MGEAIYSSLTLVCWGGERETSSSIRDPSILVVIQYKPESKNEWYNRSIRKMPGNN
jgi:hypothetical protein